MAGRVIGGENARRCPSASSPPLAHRPLRESGLVQQCSLPRDCSRHPKAVITPRSPKGEALLESGLINCRSPLSALVSRQAHSIAGFGRDFHNATFIGSQRFAAAPRRESNRYSLSSRCCSEGKHRLAWGPYHGSVQSRVRPTGYHGFGWYGLPLEFS